MRRTKEGAEKTRQRIMAAALRTFNRRGIAHTTLTQIAAGARVTRGAIYWHFKDKQALVRAIRAAVSLPLIDQADFTLLNDRTSDPLQRIERFLVDLIRVLEQDRRTRVTFSVMSFKCEYVGEAAADLVEYARKNERLRGVLTEVYKDAVARGDLRPGLAPELAAIETTLFLAGLLRLWLLDERGTGVRKQAAEIIVTHVAGRRANGVRLERHASRKASR
jgi:TetR/AcrR family acrAB operon transcriptional repressor